jgi:hypothetical protein
MQLTKSDELIVEWFQIVAAVFFGEVYSVFRMRRFPVGVKVWDEIEWRLSSGVVVVGH